MADHKDVQVHTPTSIVSPTAGHLSAADLVRLAGIQERSAGQPVTINIGSGQPEYRGDDLLRRFVPYFVIAFLGLILLGGLAAILGMVIPMIMAAVIALVGSLVSIILSLVVTIIAAVIVALGITWCQTINRRDELAERRMDLE